DRQERVELAIADERLAPDQRDVQRAMAIDEGENAVDELLPLVVAHFAQRELAAEMRVAVRIAAGTLQRTLARDLDRERRPVAGEDPAPRGEQTPHQIFHRLDCTTVAWPGRNRSSGKYGTFTPRDAGRRLAVRACSPRQSTPKASRTF